MTFKKYLPTFPPRFLLLLCREGRGSGVVGSAQQRHSGLSWRLYLSWSRQRGASGARASCAHKHLESSSRAGQVAGAAGARAAL